MNDWTLETAGHLISLSSKNILSQEFNPLKKKKKGLNYCENIWLSQPNNGNFSSILCLKCEF